MPLFDILNLIPPGLQQQIIGAMISFLAEQAGELIGSAASAKIKNLKSDGAFKKAFREGLQRAADRFVREYESEDEDLVAAIAADRDFFQNSQVQQALLAIVRKPGVYLADEREMVRQSFETVLPRRKNRERVDRAVRAFLGCLAEEVWMLPELQGIYSLQFQRMTAEATRQQVALQKAQLQATAGLGAEVRQALLQLTEAMAQRKPVPGPETPALSAKPRVYHNLPHPDYGTFIGRQKELQRIHLILRPYPHSQEHLVTIDGVGGIGKSALALEVAHRYLRDCDRLPPEECFEAIVWTSAKASVLTANGIKARQQVTRTLEDIYMAISVTLEREDITRARPEDQSELVTRALTRQRTLLVVDNLETVDDERVNAFLRELPAPTRAIVTTRHRIDVAYPVRLTGMPRKDGLTLIAQECNKKHIVLSDDEAELLYNRTGGVPLAIVWSVAQMGYGYETKSVLRRIGQPTEDIARFCFEETVDHIRDTSAHRLLIGLSLFETDASREALGHVAGLENDILSRDDGLVALQRLSLVNKQGSRFEMLPLTKRYALNELIASPDRSYFENRWIDYFLKLNDEYGDEYWNWTNYEWLLAEGENTLGLAEWSIAVGRPEIALQLHYGIMRYLDIEGRWTELIKYGEFLYGIAQSLDERRIMAWICIHWLSWLYGEQGLKRSVERAKEGLSLYREIGDKRGECLSMGYLSRSLRKSGQFQESKEKAQEMLELAHEIVYNDGVAAAHDQIGKIARDLAMWTDAKEHFERARSWCEKDEANLDVSQTMNILGNLGWVEFNLGNYERGKELCERSLTFFRRIGGRGYSAALQCQLAAIESALGNNEKALRYAKEAFYWAKRLNIVREIRAAQALLEQLGERL